MLGSSVYHACHPQNGCHYCTLSVILTLADQTACTLLVMHGASTQPGLVVVGLDVWKLACNATLGRDLPELKPFTHVCVFHTRITF